MDGLQCLELMLVGTADDTEEFVRRYLSEREDEDSNLSKILNVCINSRDMSDYDNEEEFIKEAFAVDTVESENYSDVDSCFDKGEVCYVQLTVTLSSDDDDELVDNFPESANNLCENIAVTGKYLNMIGWFYEFDNDEGDYSVCRMLKKNVDDTDCVFDDVNDPDDFPTEEFYSCDIAELFGIDEIESYADYDDENYGYEE